MVLQSFCFHACKGEGILFGEKTRKKNPSPVRTVLERRQLGYVGACLMWPWGEFGRFLIFQGCSVFSQILACRPPCTSQVLSLVSSSSSAQMLTCKILKFRKSQSDILNCQILKCCRVLYTVPTRQLELDRAGQESICP